MALNFPALVKQAHDMINGKDKIDLLAENDEETKKLRHAFIEDVSELMSDLELDTLSFPGHY